MVEGVVLRDAKAGRGKDGRDIPWILNFDLGRLEKFFFGEFL